MQAHGTCGRSGRHYETDDLNPSVLQGVRTSDEPKYYPDNYCLKCTLEGKDDFDNCFHKHWPEKAR